MEAGTHCLGLPNGRPFQLLAEQCIGRLCCTLGFIQIWWPRVHGRTGYDGNSNCERLTEILIWSALYAMGCSWSDALPLKSIYRCTAEELTRT